MNSTYESKVSVDEEGNIIYKLTPKQLEYYTGLAKNVDDLRAIVEYLLSKQNNTKE